MGMLVGEAFLFVFPGSRGDGTVPVSMWRNGTTTCVNLPVEIVGALLDNIEALALLHAEQNDSGGNGDA